MTEERNTKVYQSCLKDDRIMLQAIKKVNEKKEEEGGGEA